MAIRAFLACLLLLLPLSRTASISASTFYVSSSVSASGNGESWQTAFKKIQEGIDAASDGDTVIVAEGTYVENVKFNGKNIVLTSTDPLNPTVVANTIIDGNKAGSVVTFAGTEAETCVLSGFTVRNGKSDDGGGVCGGTEQHRRLAAIEHNIVTENSTVGWGAGVAFCDGRIENNTITHNWEGVRFCDGTIQGNSISDNSGGIGFCNGTIRNNMISRNGGGIGHCDGLIENNVLTDHHSEGGGAGICHSHGTIRGNIIQRNSVRGYWYGVGNPPSPEWQPGEGGGIYNCDGLIENNTVADNAALEAGAQGGGIAFCSGVIRGNKVLGNSVDGYNARGGGIYACDGIIERNTVGGTSVSGQYAWGAGICGCGGSVQNNLVFGNSAFGIGDCTGPVVNNTVVANAGGGISGCSGGVFNNIVWDNGSGSQVEGSFSDPFFCCIRGWTGRGGGNITKNPLFVDAANGDYRLRPESPCINAGSYYWTTWPQRDFNGNCRLAGSAPDIGCFEYGATPDSDGDLLSDEAESSAGTNPSLEDTDGDGLRDGLEVLRRSDPLAPTAPGVVRVPAEAPTIQASLLVSLSGDEIVVAPGTYRENPRFFGTNVVLRSSDPPNMDAIRSTIIDGRGGTVVTFTGNETEACVLSGFTIRNGGAEEGAGVSGGQQLRAHTHATIEYNIISANVANAPDGHGSGAGVCRSDGIIRKNLIAGNSANEYGGGLFDCDGTITNNLIMGNSARWCGGGLAYCDGIIGNNTIFGNSARQWGGGIGGCAGAIRNCIIWGNAASVGRQILQSNLPTYSCIESWTDGGEGNIFLNPHFVDAASGDFHLSPWSPCIDAGDPHSSFSEEPEPNGGRIDMGAYGNTTEASSKSLDQDADGLPDDWELLWFGSLDEDGGGDPDEDGIRNGIELRYGWNPTVAPANRAENRTKAESYQTIQSAILESQGGDEVVVHPGLYVENIHFRGNNIVLRSVDPSKPSIVARTIIDGGSLGSVVTFKGTEDDTCVLAGFTLRNGKAESGAGVRAEFDRHTHATIRNNLILGNAAPYLSSIGYGGGIALCDGVIRDNIVTGNFAWRGPGLYECDGLIFNNLIFGNTGKDGGGLDSCDGLILNNTIVGNYAGIYGNGLYCCGTITNCIIWGNTGAQAYQLYECSTPRFSCVQGAVGGEKGNIADDPQFVDAQNGDFRLMPDSPCIDAGFNDPDLPETDIVGMHRIIFGGKGLTADMGAYEFYVNEVKPVPGADQALFTWSSVADKTYSIFYSDDLLTWDLAISNFSSSGSQTTSWVDDGSQTRVPPSMVPCRFYRALENP
jgi:hypothetical protein